MQNQKDLDKKKNRRVGRGGLLFLFSNFFNLFYSWNALISFIFYKVSYISRKKFLLIFHVTTTFLCDLLPLVKIKFPGIVIDLK